MVNTIVEFYNPFGYDILKGYVIEDTGMMLTVKIEHGKHHGEKWQISHDDIIGEYDDLETEEKFYQWYSEE